MNGNGAPEGGPNLFFRASCPALIEPRIRNEDRQVVASAVTSSESAGGTLSHMVAPYDPALPDIIKDAEPSSASLSFLSSGGPSV